MDPDTDTEELDIDISESSDQEVIESSHSPASSDTHGTELEGSGYTATGKRKSQEDARQESLEKLLRNSAAPQGDIPKATGKDKIVKLSWKRANANAPAKNHRATRNLDALIVLKEEKVRLVLFTFPGTYLTRTQASTFHDFLRFVYPGYAALYVTHACEVHQR